MYFTTIKAYNRASRIMCSHKGLAFHDNRKTIHVSCSSCYTTKTYGYDTSIEHSHFDAAVTAYQYIRYVPFCPCVSPMKRTK